MLRSYVVIAWRNLTRSPTCALVSLVGLALGLAGTVVVLVFVQDSLSFDRFHRHADQICVVELEQGTAQEVHWSALAPFELADAAPARVPQVSVASAFRGAGPNCLVSAGERSLRTGEPYGVLFADEHLFEVLSFAVVEGDPVAALRDPTTAVLTGGLARRLWGEEPAVGRRLKVHAAGAAADVQVGAVVEDLPHNSSIRPEVFLSLARVRANPQYAFGFVLLLLQEGAEPAAVEEALTAVGRELPDAVRRQRGLGETVYRVHLTPLDQAHFALDLRVVYLSVFAVLAGIVLLLACGNYASLATARAGRRAREIGVRKAAGALRGQLVRQFLCESVLLCGLALVLALLLVEAALPALNGLLGTHLELRWVHDGWLWPGLLGVVIVVGLLAGAYPALYLARLSPVRVLAGRWRLHARGSHFRRGLVVLQFAAASLLVCAVGVVHRQLQLVRAAGLGYDPRHLVVLPLRGVTTDRVTGHGFIQYGGAGEPQPYDVYERLFFASGMPLQAAKGGFLGDPRMRGVAVSSSALWSRRDRLSGNQFYGSHGELVGLRRLGADPDLLQVLGIPLASGRPLVEGDLVTRRGPSGFADKVLVNEAAARALGLPDPVGQQLWRPVRGRRTLAPEQPFEARLLRDVIDREYQVEIRVMRVLDVISVLGLVIACLGLFGLMAFVAEARTREIGVRKVVGASTAGIVALLARDGLRPVLLGNLLAWPLAYQGARMWLQGYAYRVDPGLGWFAASGVAVLALALGSLSLRAARLYASNEEASRALGITLQAFARLCRRYGVETPYARRRRRRRRASPEEALAC
ncbi:MAG: FtsX-like permease family protein [Candidatus Latescibacterota bacterium]